MNTSTGKKIDVVVPYHNKDKDTIGLCISECKKRIEPLNRIFVITKETDLPFENIQIINEDSLFSNGLCLDYVEKKLQSKFPPNWKRAGWIYQQLIKIGCSQAISGLSDYYLVVDADIIFLKKMNFFSEGKTLLTKGRKIHPPYFDCFERLFDRTADRSASFIAHHMIINKAIMLELLETLEKKHNKKWFDAILDNIDFKQNSCFSEYEIYANYLKNYHPDSFAERQLDWIESLKPKTALKLLFNRAYYMAFHSYKREKNRRSFNFTKSLLEFITGNNKSKTKINTY